MGASGSASVLPALDSLAVPKETKSVTVVLGPHVVRDWRWLWLRKKTLPKVVQTWHVED